jgi:DNA-binding NarL/FixJ family response regulator
MPTRRPEGTPPDLFSAPSTTKAPGPVSRSEVGSHNQASQPRHFLPKDLAGALKRLDDAEIDALLSAVTAEAERRNRLPSSSTKKTIAPPRQPPPGPASGSLTKGRLNAVRAAFKAGVKPSAIARQFGISQSDVKEALAAEARNRTSGR